MQITLLLRYFIDVACIKHRLGQGPAVILASINPLAFYMYTYCSQLNYDIDFDKFALSNKQSSRTYFTQFQSTLQSKHILFMFLWESSPQHSDFDHRVVFVVAVVHSITRKSIQKCNFFFLHCATYLPTYIV